MERDSYRTREQGIRDQEALSESCEFSPLANLAGEVATIEAERQTKLQKERATLAFGSRSTRPLDRGRKPITESPLFGGAAQQEMF